MINRALYRLSRRLYTNTRLELGKNDIDINGEAWLQQQVLAHFKENELTIFDIGANIGDWTMSFLRQCPSTISVNIHAFEPVSQTYTKLSKNLANVSPTGQRVTLCQEAMSNSIGTTEIHTGVSLAGTNSLHSAAENIEGEIIQLTTIDQYCSLNNISSIHLVKIDIEGHDMFAIEGALKMLTNEKISILQFEYNHRWVFSRRFLKDVFDFRDKFLPNYVIGKLTGNGIYIYLTWHFEMEKFFEGNYLLLHNSLIEILGCKNVSFDNTNSLVAI